MTTTMFNLNDFSEEILDAMTKTQVILEMNDIDERVSWQETLWSRVDEIRGEGDYLDPEVDLAMLALKELDASIVAATDPWTGALPEPWDFDVVLERIGQYLPLVVSLSKKI